MSNEASYRQDESVSTRGQILNLLRDNGALPRIELARRAGLSPTSITRTVNVLLQEGVVSEGASISLAGLGRRATEVAIRREAFSVVGVQIGVGFVQLGMMDLLGKSFYSKEYSYDVSEPVDAVFTGLGSEIDALIDASGTDRNTVLGVGVAVPGPVDVAGRRLLMPINLDWHDAAVADLLEPLTGLPVVVEHNVRAMALAESRFGTGRGMGSVAFVYLRTGLGAGLVVEGQPFSGGVHGAIEIGHLQTSGTGNLCVCGSAGCLETVVSDRALRNTCAALGLTVQGDSPLMTLYEARNDNQACRDAVQHVVAQLAVGISCLVNLLNPEVILLGGVLGEIPRKFVEDLEEATKAAVFPLLRPSVRLQPSSLGLTSGVTGGGAAALDRFFYA